VIDVREVKTQSELELFIDWQWQLYKDYPYWVPPLRGDMLEDLSGAKLLFKNGPHVLLLAVQNSEIKGRLCVGIEQGLNQAKQRSEGYISLFECVNDPAIAAALFDYAALWLKERGMKRIKGPISYNGSDDYRGVLAWGFNRLPAFMNSYNPPYYPYLFIKCGFVKHEDCFSYYFDLAKSNQYIQSVQPVLMQIAATKEGGYTRKPALQDAAQAIQEIHWLMAQAMPNDWQDMIPPSQEEVEQLVNSTLLLFQEGDLVVAYAGEDRPIGFVVSSNDYNPIIKQLDGKVSRRELAVQAAVSDKIKGLKAITIFVLPEYQEQGVALLLLADLFETAKLRGYTYVEGATVGETNQEMCSFMDSLVGKPSSIYRIYTRDIG